MLALMCLINYLQSAFQQGKSKIHQIFTLRILTEIAKRTNTTLYISFFDLEKAFDKVSGLIDYVIVESVTVYCRR